MYSTTMLPSMKIRALLLWEVFALFAAESVMSSAPESSNSNITVQTDVTTNQQTTAYVNVLQPATLHPAQPTDVSAHAKETALGTANPEDGVKNKTNSSDSRWLDLTATEAAISSSKPLAPTEKVTTKDVVPVQTAAATEQAFTAGLTSTGGPQQTITASREEQPFAAVTTASGEANSSIVTTTATDKEQVSSSKTTGDAQTFPKVTSTGRGLQPSTMMTTATSAVQPPYQKTTADAVNQTTDHLQTSASSVTDMTAPATGFAASSASHFSTQHSTTITEFRSEVPSTTSLITSTQRASTFSGSTASVPTSGTVQSTSTELSSPSPSVPARTTFSSTSTGPVSNTTTANSTSPAGGLIPRTHQSRRYSSTTKAPCEPSKGSTSSEVLPCSTRGVVKQCLIIIAALAVVATIFIVSTIILCIKLTTKKYKVRKPQQATEMMCISSLLPDKSHTYTRQRHPVSNGVLVFPAGDSDEEGGDNLTLSSFLPENDRYV
ncbi:hypothetical protein CHARACLAT_029395 [Characodon lateralis]|uniref:P-selectin glycoprotein ligand 1 n=1 Tax=Characodon lateralis TaxID=208331 RepID=A0ABU7D2C0_9TELE|nr:hypothetical protein [Characodon lateralis]